MAKTTYEQRIFKRFEKVKKLETISVFNKEKMCKKTKLDSDEYAYILSCYDELKEKYNK